MSTGGPPRRSGRPRPRRAGWITSAVYSRASPSTPPSSGIPSRVGISPWSPPARTGKTARALSSAVDRIPLLVRPSPDTVWCWLGGRKRLDVAAVLDHLPTAEWRGTSLAIGEPGEGPAGRPLTHRQAAVDTGMQLTPVQGSYSHLECSTAQLGGIAYEALQTLPLSAVYGGCQMAGFEAEIAMNSCHYSLTLDNAGPPYTAGYGIACSKEGDAITVTIPSLGCVVTIPAQTTTGSLALATEGEASARTVSVAGTVTKVTYTTNSTYCGLAGMAGPKTSTKGTISVNSTLSATYLG